MLAKYLLKRETDGRKLEGRTESGGSPPVVADIASPYCAALVSIARQARIKRYPASLWGPLMSLGGGLPVYPWVLQPTGTSEVSDTVSWSENTDASMDWPKINLISDRNVFPTRKTGRNRLTNAVSVDGTWDRPSSTRLRFSANNNNRI